MHYIVVSDKKGIILLSMHVQFGQELVNAFEKSQNLVKNMSLEVRTVKEITSMRKSDHYKQAESFDEFIQYIKESN